MQPSNEQPNTLATLLDYYRIIANRKKMIAAVTASAAVIAVVYSLSLPSIYTAKAMLVPTQEEKSPLSGLMGQVGGIMGLTGGSFGGPTQSELYVTMLKSDTVKDALVDRFKLMEVYKSKFHSDANQRLESLTSIGAGKKDGVVTIAVEDKDPKRAADLANAYIDELGKMAVKLNMTGAGKNRAFLEERLAKAKGDLAQAEESLKQFQTKNKVIDITGQSKASIEGIAKLKAELAAQEVRLATLRRQFTDSSQEVKTASVTVQNLKSQVAKFEGGSSDSTLPSVSAMPSIGQEYLRLMREFKMQETLVELLTKQYEIAQYTESKDVFPLQIIQKARTPDRRSKPKRSLIVLAFTFYAFALSALAAIIINRVKGAS